MNRDSKTTTVWLTVKPEFGKSTYNRDDVVKIKVDKLYQTKPPKSACPPPGMVLEVKITMPEFVFKPFRPKLDIEIPVDAIDLGPMVKMQIEGLKDILDDTT